MSVLGSAHASTKTHIARQVGEILREKLQSVGSELIDAKTRMSELESIQAVDRDTLRLSNITLSDASEPTAVNAFLIRLQHP